MLCSRGSRCEEKLCYGGNGNRNAGRQNMNQAFNAETMNDESHQILQRVPRTESNLGKENVQCYNCNEKGHYARDCQKPRVHDAKYFREQMLLAIKYEAGSNLKDEENDFMLDNSYGDETLEELTDVVIMMAQIESADDNAASESSYDVKAVCEVNVSTRVHEQVNRVQRKTIIHTYDYDQIDSNIIFDDPYVENNGGTSVHDSTAHDEYHDIKMLFKIDSPDSEETLEDAKESRLKMRNKMVKLNHEKLNALYETFVPQKEPSAEQTYFSIPSTSNDCYETKEVTSDLSILKMPKESKLLKIFEKIGVESSNSVRRPKSKDNKSKDRVLKNTNDMRPSAHV
ncbi:retrovirus-related pol polyprotein from transposon TNT 1-94 [Tanacetum coccineum]|uniref:Retrovirus-related pol polyprotein from transposon TNT 1-94 n=1 Tax=Tanacetum coccineum TaxID=301880 RepID=A0ABQ5F8S3_9ASTR